MDIFGSETSIPNGRRSDETVYIILIGLTGAGKSSTMNCLFDHQRGTDDGWFSSATQSILEYQVESRTSLGPCPKKLTVIDTPGFVNTFHHGNTFGESIYRKDSQILASLESYLDKHEELSTCYPTAVFLVTDFSHNRIDEEISNFILLLKTIENIIQRGRLIDTNPATCNLIVVLTHFMNAPEHLHKCPEPRVRLIQGLIKTFTTIPIDIPVIMAENKVNIFGLKERSGSYELPNGDLYPLNLFKALKQAADSVKNKNISEIICSTYADFPSLEKQLLQEGVLMNISTEISRRYYDLVGSASINSSKNEMTILLDLEWAKLRDCYITDNAISLTIAKGIFSRAGISSISNIPTKTADILQLVRQMYINMRLEKTLENIGIVPPSLLDHCRSVGYFYDVRNDVLSSVTPFDINCQAITHSGFRAPTFMRVDMIGNDVIKSYSAIKCYESKQQYFASRFKQMNLSENATIGNADAKPLLGHSIIFKGMLPEKITGIREYREYSVSLTKTFTFSSSYINTIEKLPKNNFFVMSNWATLLGYGVHIIKSGFIGGAVSVTATRNVCVMQETNAEKIIKTIEVILENVGKGNVGRMYHPVMGWTFELNFHGGDPNLTRPRIDNLFSEYGKQLFIKWKNSIQLRPSLLFSELELEHISAYLKAQYGELSQCVSNAANITMGFKKFNDHVKKNMRPSSGNECNLL